MSSSPWSSRMKTPSSCCFPSTTHSTSTLSWRRPRWRHITSPPRTIYRDPPPCNGCQGTTCPAATALTMEGCIHWRVLYDYLIYFIQFCFYQCPFSIYYSNLDFKGCYCGDGIISKSSLKQRASAYGAQVLDAGSQELDSKWHSGSCCRSHGDSMTKVLSTSAEHSFERLDYTISLLVSLSLQVLRLIRRTRKRLRQSFFPQRNKWHLMHVPCWLQPSTLPLEISSCYLLICYTVFLPFPKDFSLLPLVILRFLINHQCLLILIGDLCLNFRFAQKTMITLEVFFFPDFQGTSPLIFNCKTLCNCCFYGVNNMLVIETLTEECEDICRAEGTEKKKNLCSDKTGTLTLNKLTVDKNLVEVRQQQLHI